MHTLLTGWIQGWQWFASHAVCTHFWLAEFRVDNDMHTPHSPPVCTHFQRPEFRASKAMHLSVNAALGNHPALSTLRAHTSNYLNSGPIKPCTHQLTLHWVTTQLCPPCARTLPATWVRTSKAMHTPLNTALGNYPSLSTLCTHTSNYLSSGLAKPCTHHLTLYSHSSTHFQPPDFWTNEAMHTPLNTALGDHHPALFSCIHTAAHTSNRLTSELTKPCTHHLTLHWVTTIQHCSPVHTQQHALPNGWIQGWQWHALIT